MDGSVFTISNDFIFNLPLISKHSFVVIPNSCGNRSILYMKAIKVVILVHMKKQHLPATSQQRN